MAGRIVARSADLVFIGTTSLYGQRPSQYDRIVFPTNDGKCLRYLYLGKTLGLGTFQFGEQTVSELATLLAQGNHGQQVNSVFGEGVNPRLRKIRDGLDALGLPTENLLNHGSPRLVYGVELVENTRGYLLGVDRTPKYILSRLHAVETSRQITSCWATRWMLPRIARDEVISRVVTHSNRIYPIRHGARVKLPEEDVGEFIG